MKLHLHSGSDLVLIKGVGARGIVIGETCYSGAIAVQPTGLIENWNPESFEQITDESMRQLAQFDPQVVLLGTGRSQRWPDRTVLQALTSLRSGTQVGIEVMDTKAACRTYNILASEGRQVVAALLPIK